MTVLGFDSSENLYIFMICDNYFRGTIISLPQESHFRSLKFRNIKI